MTTPSNDAADPVPVRVVLPADPVLGHPEQEVVARLWMRRQTETGWLYLVGLPSYLDLEGGGVEAAEYRVWVRAPDHVRPVDGVDYDQVATEKLEGSPQAVVREVLGERQPSGWVLAKVRDGRGPARSVLHAPDCEEAPAGAPLLDVDRALRGGPPRLPTSRGMQEREEPCQGSGPVGVGVPRRRQIRLKEVRVELDVVLESRREKERQAVGKTCLIQPRHQVTRLYVQEGTRGRGRGQIAAHEVHRPPKSAQHPRTLLGISRRRRGSDGPRMCRCTRYPDARGPIAGRRVLTSSLSSSAC
ncbi:hypothetical protein ABZT03_39745 [Streptomyces sp. NPDC005574]|uniref:hypothetical protein n=1 Tax=Streptomyces sp. NPDC005574 TaxID=3156891 RepID=UPI0033BE57EC